jgi:hypothetical protein
MGAGIIELDLHGLNCEQAKTKIDRTIAAADGSVYMIRLIHGYHGGTQILNMIQDEYSYGRSPKVVRLQNGINPGVTELVLREF